MKYCKRLPLWLAALTLGVIAQSQAQTIYFFANDFDPKNGAPANVTADANFSAICGADRANRLNGLDLVRAFAGQAACSDNRAARALSTQPDYIFLIDDSQPLSAYLQDQFKQQNALQDDAGRPVIKPTALRFSGSGDRAGFSILIAGEMAYRKAGSNADAWSRALNQRLQADQVVDAGGAESDIYLAYHGSFFNQRMEEIENPTVAQSTAFFEKSMQELAKLIGPSVALAAPPAKPAVTPKRKMNDYMKQCNSYDVPLPPVWNPSKGKNQWQKRGVLKTPAVLAVSAPYVEVWAYDSAQPKGICIALPRMGKVGGSIDDDIKALGIICQSETTGKACFWDNIKRPVPEISSGQPNSDPDRRKPRPKILGKDTRNLDPINMSDGYNLNENCTGCHRGSNVYLIQAKTPLAVDSVGAPKLVATPKVRYQPLSGTPASPTWANPPSTTQKGLDNAVKNDSQCSLCHSTNGNNSNDNEMPALTLSYCKSVLEGIIGVNMPTSPDAPKDWNSPDYIDEVRFLANKCCDLGHNLKGVATKGACKAP